MVRINGHCYMFGLDKKSWFESKVACNTKNAYLAKVETPRENDWIIQQLHALSKEFSSIISFFQHNSFYTKYKLPWIFWIGGNTLRKVGDWKWESTGENIGYTFFHPTEPNSPTVERCLCYFPDDSNAFYWGDFTCSSKQGYVCEKDN
ncbi:perlucin-like protein [Saccostrea echinata]|uniref:perlucin-like protein n=1 Tax=Saccostrea echinata TaxID=191078 RepID=UPI002A7F56CB|nr:perlucin-like protein [Saccostrea echinata]